MTSSETPTRRRALHAYVCLMRAAESVTQRTHGHLATHDLTIGQLGVLEALLHLGPLRQCQLAQKLLRSPANLTTVLDNLERRGAVERQPAPDDRRAKLVHLTRPGRRLIEEVFPAHADGIARELASLGAAEQRELARLCKQLGKQATKERKRSTR